MLSLIAGLFSPKWGWCWTFAHGPNIFWYVRTKATSSEREAARRVVERLWAVWSGQHRGGSQATVAELARRSGVEPETLRVLVRSAENGTIKSGPGFVTVARIARPLKVDLNALARLALPAEDGE